MSRSIGLLLQVRSLLYSLLPRSALLGAGLAVGLTACEKPSAVAVRVSIPAADTTETPAAGVGVVALPYDRDSVLGALAARAQAPRPGTVVLDSLFARFRGPFTAYTTLSYAATKLRDSLGLLRSRLDSLPRNAPEYRALYARFGGVSDSLTNVESGVERARATLDRARAEFVSRSESLRTAVRHWEDSTYRGYDSIVENLAKTRGRAPVTDTTDATGWAHFTLQPGRWWLYARAWDTSDPNAEWYWNAPADGDTVLLSSRTGRRQPRY